MSKNCYIQFNEGEKGIDVVFEGIWSRLDIEKSSMAMLRQLPKHIKAIRNELDEKRKEKEHAGRKTRTKG